MPTKLTTRGRLPALVTACLLGVALPQSAIVAKEKVKPTPAATSQLQVDYSVDIPTIDAVGANLSNDVLSEVLSGNVADHAEELAGLDATSISVPEITLTVTSETEEGSQETALTFTDLLLEDVADGKAARVSLGSVGMVTDKASFDFGTMSAANLDIAGILGLYGLVESDQTELEIIYTDLQAEGGTLEAEEVSCTIGGMTGAQFKARPLKTSFGEMMAISQAMEDDPETVDPALMGRFLKMYADILTAFETSEISFDGMSCDGTTDEGQAMNLSLAGITMGGMSPGVYPTISMEGFDVVVDGDGAMSLENFTVKPMDLTSTIATLEAAPEMVDEAWLEANARALIPAMEGFGFSGLDIDIPDPDAPDSRIQAKVGSFDLSLADYLNGIPTTLDMSAANVEAQIPENSGDDSLEQLRALGITDINAGFRVAAAWDEAASSIDLEEVSISGVDLASVVLAGKIANAGADLFALDPDVAMAAGMALAVKSLDLTVTDAGLSDIILAVAAADQGADPETLRPVFAGLAQGTVISMMAGAADAAKLGEAINSFVAGKAKTLVIGIEAKTDPGLGMMDFMAAKEDPTSLIGKVNISAEAK